MTKLKKKYLQYLESGHWKRLRDQAFERDGHKCVRCGFGGKLQGHHKTYRQDLRNCTVDDIETLCKRCHKKHHLEKREQRRERRRERKRLFSQFDSLVLIICSFDAH